MVRAANARATQNSERTKGLRPPGKHLASHQCFDSSMKTGFACCVPLNNYYLLTFGLRGGRSPTRRDMDGRGFGWTGVVFDPLAGECGQHVQRQEPAENQVGALSLSLKSNLFRAKKPVNSLCEESKHLKTSGSGPSTLEKK